jgi:hypothetical protein
MGSEPKARAPGGGGERVVYKPLQKALYNPQSVFDYVVVVVRPLVDARLIDAIILETGMVITRVKRGFLMVELGDFVVYVPTRSEELFRELLRKYKPALDAWYETLSNDVDKLNELLLKGLNGKASEQELGLLGYFFGDLQGEVVSFVRGAHKYSIKRQEEFLIKYVSIGFQRVADRVVQQLSKDGAVLRDGAPSGTLRLMWLPQQGGVVGRGVYAIPNGKVQVLSLLRGIMPGLVDFSTDENEYTRVARLSQALSDVRDVDTLVNLIVRLYSLDAGLPRQWEEVGLPKKYIPLVLLSHALSKGRGVFSFIDFEGTTPITVVYPKIPLTEAAGGGGYG